MPKGKKTHAEKDAIKENPIKATKNYRALLEDPPRGG